MTANMETARTFRVEVTDMACVDDVDVNDASEALKDAASSGSS